MNDTKIKPLGYYVLIRMDDVEEKTESGIITKTSQDLRREKLGQCTGVILEFGNLAFKNLSNGCESPEDWGVEVGDRVEFTSYDGKIPKGGKDDTLRLIQDQHIVGKVKGKDHE